MATTPKYVKHPERICWGCDNYCPADDLQCGLRTRHPIELGGEHWREWLERLATAEGSNRPTHRVKNDERDTAAG